ncbi:MAG: SEC-C domain-containing protein [Solirubrobacterales bacterium]|nr:SEC-C domain-containing protein [Solirubrobacterales bacterium]
MSIVLAQGRARSALLRLYVAKDARRGRDDPCTCGSGTRWKHCHGR